MNELLAGDLEGGQIVKKETLHGNEDWNAYADYNKILRAWFVAFGVGAPAAFLVNKDLVRFLSVQKGDPSIFILFLIGAASQILMAFINKIINWCAYYKMDTFPDRKPRNFWEHAADIFSKASDWFLIDVVSDLITMICFCYAMKKLVYVIIATPLSLQ
ncbi:MAG TPA: hypothetical protein VLN91_02385 [Nitrospirota bacterium]|nr:hypothetical protein [Nitrospirota bacterium]